MQEKRLLRAGAGNWLPEPAVPDCAVGRIYVTVAKVARRRAPRPRAHYAQENEDAVV